MILRKLSFVLVIYANGFEANQLNSPVSALFLFGSYVVGNTNAERITPQSEELVLEKSVSVFVKLVFIPISNHLLIYLPILERKE